MFEKKQIRRTELDFEEKHGTVCRGLFLFYMELSMISLIAELLVVSQTKNTMKTKRILEKLSHN